jgi:hypothetical protein
MHRPTVDTRATFLDGAGQLGGQPAPVYGLAGGIAIISIQGMLARGVPWFCDGTNYDWIRVGFDCAIRDPEVKAIVFDVNSPGGAVDSCCGLCDGPAHRRRRLCQRVHGEPLNGIPELAVGSPVGIESDVAASFKLNRSRILWLCSSRYV